MKTIVYGILVLLSHQVFAVDSVPARSSDMLSWGPVCGGLQMRSEFEREGFGTRENVVLTLRLRNATNSPVRFIEGEYLRDYDIFVGDKDGNALPRTRYGKLLKSDKAIWAGSKFGRTLQPQEEVTYRFIINAVYDMTIKGVYEVFVRRKFTNNCPEGTLVSNKAVLKIVESTVAWRVDETSDKKP